MSIESEYCLIQTWHEYNWNVSWMSSQSKSFVKSFIPLLFLHTILFLLIVHYSPHIPFRLKSATLLLLIGNVPHGLDVPCVEAMCCVTTQVHAHTMPALVLDYWLPAENIFPLVCTVVRRAWSLRLTKVVP